MLSCVLVKTYFNIEKYILLFLVLGQNFRSTHSIPLGLNLFDVQALNTLLCYSTQADSSEMENCVFVPTKPLRRLSECASPYSRMSTKGSESAFIVQCSLY